MVELDVSIAPGGNVVGRWDDAVALAFEVADLPSPRAEEVTELLERSEAPVAAVVDLLGEPRVIVRGGGRVVDELTGDEVEEPLLATTRLRLELGPEAGTAPVVAGTNLLAGLAPAAVVTVGRSVGPEAAEELIVSISSLAVEARDPLPQEGRAEVADAPLEDGDLVLGILCAHHHFNNPAAAYCQVCGRSMVHLTHNLVEGRRPTVGFLVFDDGSTYALDRTYVVGRQPSSGDANAVVRLTENADTLSAQHAEIGFVDWSLVVTDLGSTNGTFLWEPGSTEWTRLVSGETTPVPPGSSMAFGHRTCQFESVTRSA